jgi:phage-related protein
MAKKSVDPIAKLTEAVEKLTKEVVGLKADLAKTQDYIKRVDALRHKDSTEIIDTIEEDRKELAKLLDEHDKVTEENFKILEKYVDQEIKDVNKSLTNEIKSTDKWVEQIRESIEDKIGSVENTVYEIASSLREEMKESADAVRGSLQSSLSASLNNNSEIMNQAAIASAHNLRRIYRAIDNMNC